MNNTKKYYNKDIFNTEYSRNQTKDLKATLDLIAIKVVTE